MLLSVASQSQQNQFCFQHNKELSHPGIKSLFSSLASTCADSRPPSSRMFASNTLMATVTLTYMPQKQATGALEKSLEGNAKGRGT
jgi:hypothetical protein